MGKSHYWVTKYQKQGDLIEIKVLDSSESVIEKWKFNIQDKRTGTKILRELKEKYGFSPEIYPTKQTIFDKEKDLGWLKD